MRPSARAVVLVGVGGIGHPAAMALADLDAPLALIDDDLVEASNLHRLPFASPADVGRAKTDVLLAALRALGRRDDRAVAARFLPANARALLADAAVVIEGSDNYATKFLVADACGLSGVASVHGGAVAWHGTVLAVRPGASACYRCVFEDLPREAALDCATAGVFGPVTAVIGALMAAEAVRLLAGDDSTTGSVASYDGLRGAFRASRFARRTACPLCGARSIRDLDEARYIAPGCAA